MSSYTQPIANSASYSTQDKPTSQSFLLRENGDKLLLESGSNIIIGTALVGTDFTQPTKNSTSYTQPTRN